MAPISRRKAPPCRKLVSSKALPLADVRGWWAQLDDFCKQKAGEGWTLPKSITFFPGVKGIRVQLRLARPAQDGRNGQDIVTHRWSIPGGEKWASFVATL